MKKMGPYIIALVLFCIATPAGAQDLVQKQTKKIVRVEKLPASINSPFDEIMPVLANDGKQLFFTRVGSDDFTPTLYFNGEDLFWKMPYQRYLRSLRKTYEWIGGTQVSDPVHSKFNQDIWVAEIKDSVIGKVSRLAYPANNALPNALCSATPNPQAFIVINQFFPKGGMQEGFSVLRRRPDGKWNFPEPINIEGFHITGQEVNLNLSKDGSVLLLSMRRSDSHGLQDLYVSFREPGGNWSYPINLGPAVNSSWKESSPFLAADNRTLFFASNRPDVFGGTNLYSVVRLDDTWRNWSQPTLLVSPVNSNANESHPAFNFDTNMLFFSSDRDGNSNIYRVKIELPTARLIDEPKEFVALDGQVVDQNGWLVPGAKILYRAYNFEKFKEVAVAEDGTFSIRVPKGRKIHLKAAMDGYKGKEKHLFYRLDYVYFQAQFTKLTLIPDPRKETIAMRNGSKASIAKPPQPVWPDPKPLSKTKTRHKKNGHKRRPKGQKIDLKPIYFERSKAHILPKSFRELNKLANFLKENHDIRIRVEGHTDSNGKPKDLLELSQRRALAIKAYLVNRGIDEQRIESVGYGGQFPVVDNSTEANRRKNRRVEVYIIKKPDSH